MANPVLSRPDAFTPAYNPYEAQAQPSYYGDHTQGQWNGDGQQAYNPYAAPTQQAYNPYAAPTQPAPYVTPDTTGLMTYDGVTQKAALILLVLAAVAYSATQLIPPLALLPASIVCGLVAVVVPLVALFRRTVGPVLALFYAVFEGVFIGTISMVFEAVYPGIVVQAIFGTFIAAALVLAAFRFIGMRTSSKMSRLLLLCLAGYAAVALFSFIASLFGFDTGLFPGPTGPVSGWAWLAAIIGVTLAVFSLLDDFTYIEKGVRMGAPASQGWTAAWGLSVTLVWLYLNLLRIIGYLSRR
ncbi:MAG: Bax inhibitor-1/YccA family protein [Propionibacteriaceae bacterium]|jgi:uncharacterized YccA/Bax inhibitor family protein|nr:Bax inhibitor-1/YccA family protein [Propionibacteriaceae bacterium]